MLSQAVPVAAFMAAVAIAASGGILLAGHFPTERLPADRRLPSWRLLVWLNVVLLFGLLVVSVWLAAEQLRWPAAVIGGGLALLFGPLLFQAVPRRLVDQRRGLVGQAVAAAATLLLLWCVAPAHGL